MEFNLYKALENKGNVADSTICHDLIEAYRKDKSSATANFLDLFIKALGAGYEIDPERVANAIQDDSFVDFLTEILRDIDDYDEEKYIFSNETTLNCCSDFIREFCRSKNPMLKDNDWMNLLALCLSTIAHFPKEYTISVGVYFSLKIAHDLEMLRIESQQKYSSHKAVFFAVETQIKKNITTFLQNTAVNLAVSHMCFDHISRMFCALIRSSNQIYILEMCVLEQIMCLIILKHKDAKEVLTLLNEVLNRSAQAVKRHLVEFLSKYTGTLIKLIDADSVAVQIATIKIVLTAQRFLGKTSFLLPNENQIIYSKMISSNSNIRETAKKFFLITYSSDGQNQEQTMLQALMQLCEKYEDNMQNLPMIINLIWQHITPLDEFINQVCRTKSPVAYKILHFYVKKMMEPDFDVDLRRSNINEILLKFNYIAASCEHESNMCEIVFETLHQMDLKTNMSRRHDTTTLPQIVEFILSNMMGITFMPTLHMINMLLNNLIQFNEATKEKTKSIMKDLAKRFMEKRDENVVIHLSAALYIHKVAHILPPKRQLNLLQATHAYLSEYDSHTKAIVHHVLTIHAELLSSQWEAMTLDREKHIQEVMRFIDEHLVPFMTFDVHEDKLFNLQVMQAFSLTITNFVKNCPSEGYPMWDNMQPMVYKYILEVVFASPIPSDDTAENEKIFLLCRNFMNALLITMRCLQTIEHPIHTAFGKFIFHLAKSFWYPDVLQEAIKLVTNDLNHGMKIFGSVCHSFTFFQEEKPIRSFFQEIDQVITSLDSDDKRNSFRHGIVLQYIENVGNYIERSQERGTFNKNADKDRNCLGILKYIKDLLKACTQSQKKDIVTAQGRFINQSYLNKRERDSLNAFVTSIS